MKGNKITTLLIVLVAIVSFFFLGRIISNGDQAIESSAELQNSLVSPFISLAYIVMAIIVVLVVFFVLRHLITHPKALKSALISSGLFLALVLITFFLSSGEAVTNNAGETLITAYGSRWVGAGLRLFYILSVLAIGLMFFFGIKKAIKN